MVSSFLKSGFAASRINGCGNEVTINLYDPLFSGNITFFWSGSLSILLYTTKDNLTRSCNILLETANQYFLDCRYISANPSMPSVVNSSLVLGFSLSSDQRKSSSIPSLIFWIIGSSSMRILLLYKNSITVYN